MLWLSKVLLPLVLPPGGCLTLLALAALARWRGRRRLALALATCAFASLALASAPAVARWLAWPLETRFAPVDLASPPLADAIVVLGGGAAPAPRGGAGPELLDSSDRVWRAAQLYASGAAPRVLLCGGRAASVSGGPPEARAMGDLLALWGVPQGVIEEEVASRDTRENCAAAAAAARAQGWRRVLLVTSALHMPRAVRDCSTPGVQWIPAPADYRASAEGDEGLFAWLPNATSLKLSAMALKEWLALALGELSLGSGETR